MLKNFSANTTHSVERKGEHARNRENLRERERESSEQNSRESKPNRRGSRPEVKGKEKRRRRHEKKKKIAAGRAQVEATNSNSRSKTEKQDSRGVGRQTKKGEEKTAPFQPIQTSNLLFKPSPKSLSLL